MTLLLGLLGLAIMGLGVALVLRHRGSIDQADAADGGGADQPERNIQEVIRRLEDEDTNEKVSALAQIAALITPPDRVVRLKEKMVQAAETERYTLAELFEFKLMGLLIGFVLGAGVMFVRGVTNLTLGIAAGLTIFGFIAIDLALDRRAEARQKAIERAVPDMLDQMVITVEAGLGLESALTRIAATNDNPLADEFTRTLRDMRLGASRGEALHALLDRVDVPDLRLFIRALIQADRGGIAIAGVCRVQADEARTKRRQRAEEKAMKMPVKLVFPLVTCILPSLFIVVLGPAVMRLSESGLT